MESYPLDGYGRRESEDFYAISALIRKRGSVRRLVSAHEILETFAESMSDDPAKTYDRLLFLERFQNHEARRLSAEYFDVVSQLNIDERVVRLLERVPSK